MKTTNLNKLGEIASVMSCKSCNRRTTATLMEKSPSFSRTQGPEQTHRVGLSKASGLLELWFSLNLQFPTANYDSSPRAKTPNYNIRELGATALVLQSATKIRSLSVARLPQVLPRFGRLALQRACHSA
jgi:hypothetical protein